MVYMRGGEITRKGQMSKNEDDDNEGWYWEVVTKSGG